MLGVACAARQHAMVLLVLRSSCERAARVQQRACAAYSRALVFVPRACSDPLQVILLGFTSGAHSGIAETIVKCSRGFA